MEEPVAVEMPELMTMIVLHCRDMTSCPAISNGASARVLPYQYGTVQYCSCKVEDCRNTEEFKIM